MLESNIPGTRFTRKINYISNHQSFHKSTTIYAPYTAMPMETRCQKKLWISKIPAIRFLYCSLWAQIFNKKAPNFWKKSKKKNLGEMLSQDRPKTQAKCFIRSGEIPSSRQTSINKTNDCVMNSERGALVRGSDQPSGHSSVHNTADDRWRAPARRLIQKHVAAGV